MKSFLFIVATSVAVAFGSPTLTDPFRNESFISFGDPSSRFKLDRNGEFAYQTNSAIFTDGTIAMRKIRFDGKSAKVQLESRVFEKILLEKLNIKAVKEPSNPVIPSYTNVIFTHPETSDLFGLFQIFALGSPNQEKSFFWRLTSELEAVDFVETPSPICTYPNFDVASMTMVCTYGGPVTNSQELETFSFSYSFKTKQKKSVKRKVSFFEFVFGEQNSFYVAARIGESEHIAKVNADLSLVWKATASGYGQGQIILNPKIFYDSKNRQVYYAGIRAFTAPESKEPSSAFFHAYDESGKLLWTLKNSSIKNPIDIGVSPLNGSIYLVGAGKFPKGFIPYIRDEEGAVEKNGILEIISPAGKLIERYEAPARDFLEKIEFSPDGQTAFVSDQFGFFRLGTRSLENDTSDAMTLKATLVSAILICIQALFF